MRVLGIDRTPLHELLYQSVAPGGRKEICPLPLFRGTVDRMPDGVDALLCTSDLQGVCPSPHEEGPGVLLGEALAEEVQLLGELGEIPPAASIGVILAGDLYVRPGLDRRGGAGDVRSVWQAFRRRFHFVVGVAGNHDAFGNPRDMERFRQEPGVYLLDGQVQDLGGLVIGGVGGVIGNPRRSFRRDEDVFLRCIDEVLAARPDVLLLHEGPDVPYLRLRGNPAIREKVDARGGLLLICGHNHWPLPLAQLPSGPQVLNVDARAVLLQAA